MQSSSRMGADARQQSPQMALDGVSLPRQPALVPDTFLVCGFQWAGWFLEKFRRDGLFFLPYLTGERTPHPDPLARGAFVGLTVRHTLAHLTRAVLEGVAYGLRDSFELMKNAGLAEIKQVRVTGGGARSRIWLQILADILGTELVTVNSVEGAAYGAALLAATGAGAFPDVETACEAAIQVTSATEPGPAKQAYQELYPLYRDLYPALRPSFNAVA
jgi:xylulokinase